MPLILPSNSISAVGYEVANSLRFDGADYLVRSKGASETSLTKGTFSFWTQQDSDDGLMPDDKSVGDVKVEGLKTIKKRIIKEQASNLLAKHDWQVVKATEVSDYSVPSAVTTYRANVRTKSNQMETMINNCTTVDELKALYEYTNTGTEANPVFTRPLPEFPTEVI